MPWTTPTLKETRRLTRDYVLSQLGAKAMIPNSVLRIMSDAKAGLAHLTMLYLDWLAKQLMPDTAETEWLDRHGVIWLDNADGSKGRKAATYASGTVQFEGTVGVVAPIGTMLTGAQGVQYQTVTDAVIGSGGFGTSQAAALTPGIVGNLVDGTVVGIVTPIVGITIATLLGDMTGGVDQETDDQLRERILFRIQSPPMGGSQADYIRWALAVPGVTRAWAACEIGPGTMTVRFLMDDLYPENHGLPQQSDIDTVRDYIYSKRPVTVVDTFVMAPMLYFYDITIRNLTTDDPTVRARIEQSLKDMEFKRSKPGQTWYRSWVDEAISQAVGEETHELDYETTEMPAPAYMPVLGPSSMSSEQDKHVTRTGEDYAVAMMALLPQGQAWPRAEESALVRVVKGLCRIWGDFEIRASHLLERESDPRLTVELLPDWERNWGLPDPCYKSPQSVYERQQALVMRMTMMGAQSRQFFIDIAAMIGYTITISEYRPFFIAMDGCGDCRQYGAAGAPDPVMRNQWGQPIMNQRGDGPVAEGELSAWPNYGLGPLSNRYYWTVHVEQARLTWFRAASGQTGVDPHLRIGIADDLECLLDRWKPAHTDIIYDYSGLQTGGEIAGTP